MTFVVVCVVPLFCVPNTKHLQTDFLHFASLKKHCEPNTFMFCLSHQSGTKCHFDICDVIGLNDVERASQCYQWHVVVIVAHCIKGH